MRHSATNRFWASYEALPTEVPALADKNFELLQLNLHHPSLQFKQVGKFRSARVGIHHRALALEVDDGFLWVWVGSHADYDKLVH